MTIEEQIQAMNDCGKVNDHEPEWFVSMTSPEGKTGVTLRKCTDCMVVMLGSPAMRQMNRTLHVRAI